MSWSVICDLNHSGCNVVQYTVFCFFAIERHNGLAVGICEEPGL